MQMLDDLESEIQKLQREKKYSNQQPGVYHVERRSYTPDYVKTEESQYELDRDLQGPKFGTEVQFINPVNTEKFRLLNPDFYIERTKKVREKVAEKLESNKKKQQQALKKEEEKSIFEKIEDQEQREAELKNLIQVYKKEQEQESQFFQQYDLENGLIDAHQRNEQLQLERRKQMKEDRFLKNRRPLTAPQKEIQFTGHYRPLVYRTRHRTAMYRQFVSNQHRLKNFKNPIYKKADMFWSNKQLIGFGFFDKDGPSQPPPPLPQGLASMGDFNFSPQEEKDYFNYHENQQRKAKGLKAKHDVKGGPAKGLGLMGQPEPYDAEKLLSQPPDQLFPKEQMYLQQQKNQQLLKDTRGGIDFTKQEQLKTPGVGKIKDEKYMTPKELEEKQHRQMLMEKSKQKAEKMNLVRKPLYPGKPDY